VIAIARGGALSLWDWASQIARRHREDFTQVCASLLGDVIDAKIVTSPPLAEGWRQYLCNVETVGKFERIKDFDFAMMGNTSAFG
jgi:hypothetical protein